MTEPMYERGDEVEITIPHQNDPDRYLHRLTGTVLEQDKDSLHKLTGEPSDKFWYLVEVNGEEHPFRERDLR